MENEDSFSKLTTALINKTITKEELLDKVKQDFSLIHLLLRGVGSTKATVRYGCSKVLMDLSKDDPQKLYSHMNFFIDLLDSKFRILTWNSLAIIANLTQVDSDKKFDAIFDKYYSFLENDYMVTVANVVGNSATIALAKPYLIPRITEELLKVKDISLTPHLSEECKRVIAQQTINSFSMFFDKIEQKEKVMLFVKSCIDSPRKKLRTAAEKFLEKWE